jgi:hypothetical protein
MPCVQEQAHRERQQYIRSHRRDVNPYEAVDDPLELLKLAHVRRESGELIRYLPCPKRREDLYAELDAGRTAALVSHATKLFEYGDVHQAQDIAGCLTAFTSANINSVLDRFIAASQFYPGYIFLRANEDIRDALIGRLARLPNRQENSLTRNHLLLALAWIGDEKVIDLFAQWRTKPPLWAGTLFVPPEKYGEEAGWQLSHDLKRRDLYYMTCYALVCVEGEVSASPAIAVTERSDRCPSCGTELRNLLELDGASAPSLLPGSGRLAIPFCELCCPISGRLGSGSTWTPNEMKADRDGYETLGERLPLRRLAMAQKSRSPWHAAHPFLPTTFSQVGGHPTWIQDADYPQCTECQQTMTFVGQVAPDELADFQEGMHYAFLCAPCRTTATRYQQT